MSVFVSENVFVCETLCECVSVSFGGFTHTCVHGSHMCESNENVHRGVRSCMCFVIV